MRVSSTIAAALLSLSLGAAAADYTIGGGLDPDDPNVASQFADPVQELVEAEYFIGADPGEGNGTPLQLESTENLARDLEELAVPVGDLPVGTHHVALRVKDSNDRWSNPLIRRFTVSTYTIAGGLDANDPDIGSKFAKPAAQLVEAEYFIGADPGEGNGTPLLLENTLNLARDLENLPAPVGDLPEGTHDLSVRVKDEDDRWSNPLVRRFTVTSFTFGGGIDPGNPDAALLLNDPFPQIVQAEYFVGADPGEGHGTPLTLEVGASLSKALQNVALGLNLPGGTHEVGVRVRDEAGRWSNPLLRRFNLYSQEVIAVQRPGTKLVDLTYDLLYGSLPYTVTVLISSDGGLTWAVPTGSLTGDIGNAVPPGPGRQIVWHAGEDWDGEFSEDMHFRVIAYLSAQLVPGGFAAVNPGSFTMGSPGTEIGRDAGEIERAVTMAEPFYLAINEVTWSEWNTVRDQGPTYGYTDIAAGQNGMTGDGSGNHPVTNVSWQDAVKWCNLKSEIEGKRPVYYSASSFVPANIIRTGIPVVHAYGNADGYRLPSEAEWEFACRAGTSTAFHTGEITDPVTDANLDLAGWYSSNSGANTHVVGGKAANALGLNDVHGNVQEWCWDGFSPYPPGPQWDPVQDAGASRVLRGGSWNLAAADCRAASRAGSGQNSRGTDIGFRLAVNFQGLSVLSTPTGAGAVVDSRDFAAGNLVGGVRPAVTGEVFCTAVQPDGKVLVGGDFSAIDGVARSNIARLNPDGSLDLSFNPAADLAVLAIAVQPDGGILVAGDFGSIASGQANFLARLHEDGSLDESFHPFVEFGKVSCLAMQADGMILLGGEFSSIDGEWRDFCARLHPDGSLDAGFAPFFGGPVLTMAVQEDGKILAGGSFFEVNFVPRNYLARLETDGSLDAGFDPNPSDEVTCLAVQPDRRILVGGKFIAMGVELRNYLARLTSTGILDGTFVPEPNDWVNSIALQTDDQVLVGGNFTIMDGQACSGLGRLDRFGSLDAGFQPEVVGSVNTVAVLGDGRVMFGGPFIRVGLVTRLGLAWLDNDPVVESLTAPNSSRLTWLRDGTAPEAVQTSFELSTDNGATWQSLGHGRRSGSAWSLFGINLPESGMVRGWARTKSGSGSSSSGLVTSTANFSGLVTLPEIAVERGGSVIEDRGSVSLGSITLGSSLEVVLTIRNTGFGDLSGVSVSVVGTHPADYAVTVPPAATVSGPYGTTSFTVRFTPSDLGDRLASLRVANNDPNEDPYDIDLSGRGVIGGNVDPDFAPAFNGLVRAVAVQPDGSVVVGGEFTVVEGGLRKRLVRILPDGTRDPVVIGGAGGANDVVNCLAIQRDGKILLGGRFTSVSNQLRNRIARLLPSGVIESTATFNTGTGADGEVLAMALQLDGKILIVGNFTQVNGKPRGSVARLNENGTVEDVTTFDAGSGADGPVRCVALQSDGSIIIGGSFTQVAGIPRAGLARLLPDGSLDAGFAPVLDGEVTTMAVDSEDRILFSGEFTMVDGQPRLRLARLLADGTLESTDTFDAGTGLDGAAHSLALQADGSFVMGGAFAQVNGNLRGYLARLFPNGTLETTITFDPGVGANAPVEALALRPDGRIVVGGAFSAVGGFPRNHLALLFNGPPDVQLGTTDSTRAEWMRDDTAPELALSSFDLSTDGGTTWTQLGEGVRIPGGWELTGMSLPSTGLLRVQGGSSSGSGNGSGGLIEGTTLFVNAPTVVTLPATDLAANSALLQAQITPHGEANVFFEYGPDASLGSQTAGQLVSGSDPVEVQSLVTSLIGNSTYHFRPVAVTSGGIYYGSLLTFDTAQEPPLVATGNPIGVTETEATLVGAVNPRGRGTTVHFEYGATTLYGNSTLMDSPVMIPAGTVAVDVSVPISVSPGEIVHYRIVATSTGGTARGSDVSFEAAVGGEASAPPSVTTGSANGITTTGATLQGTVNPNGGFTNAYFEYGLTNTYGQVTPGLGAGNGNIPTNLFSVVTNLAPGMTYHYRLVGTNSVGTTVGADSMFTTDFLPPHVETGAAEALATTTTRVHGSVRANGAPTQVFVEYGANGGDFTSNTTTVTATPAQVAGEVEMAVLADLENLRQGVTYHYRLGATSSGGTTSGATGTFAIEILSGLTQVFPDPPEVATGSLTVTLTPATITTGWRFVGEQRWRSSGETVNGLVAGDRRIEYRPVPGFIQPAPEDNGVTPGQALAITRDYFTSAQAGNGALTVTLLPSQLADSGVPENERAQWRFLGEDDTKWRDSGTQVSGLSVGNYLVECKPVDGRLTPAVAAVELEQLPQGDAKALTLVYLITTPPVGIPPVPVDYNDTATNPALPYAYVGQIRSDVGTSTGFVVKPRVVATAAHVVFDDLTLSGTTGLQWLFQRDRDNYEPTPHVPRGYYLPTDYAAKVAADNSPGESSPATQDRDVAAVYFADRDAGRAGYGGFLASDLSDHEFILSNANKMLVGFPVEGIAEAKQGQMHATPAANIQFTQGFGRTYLTTEIRSSGGNSGGPLCVEHEGSWYPAAVYLGGTGQSVVRAIDSFVVDLFNRAQVSGGGGDDNVGGGITRTIVTPIASLNLGTLTVEIEPPEAVARGAGWRLSPETLYRVSGAQKRALNPGPYIVELSPAAGYAVPPPQTVLIDGGVAKTITITYCTELEGWRLANFGSKESVGLADDAADPDGDGCLNIDEFRAGTNPNDANSKFEIETVTRHGDGSVTITAEGIAGRRYLLERLDDPVNMTWIQVDSVGPLAADGQVSLGDTPPPGSALYRIGVSIPSP